MYPHLIAKEDLSVYFGEMMRYIIKRRLQCFFIYFRRVYLVCHAQLWQFIPKKMIKGQKSIPNESVTQELFSLLRVIENNDNIRRSPQSQREWILFLLMPKPRRHSSYFHSPSMCISLKCSALALS